MSQQSSLLTFLAKTRTSLLHATSPSKSFAPHAFVLGNPSADLDSFVSAVLYAYFCSQHSILPARQPKRLTVPLINLPTVGSNDLWRLRPEFGTALELATGCRFRAGSSETEERSAPGDAEATLRNYLITIADTRAATASTQSRALFPPHAESQDGDDTFPLVLVDHNALTVSTVEDPRKLPFEIVGCIDHHVDESFVAETASPRIVKTGIGSCASLVVDHLRSQGFWAVGEDTAKKSSQRLPEERQATGKEEIAKLALSAILIDTANLTAKGKVSEIDRQAVSSLEHFIEGFGRPWNRDDFYSSIASAKETSLDNLTPQEIFDRDYKEWIEKTGNGRSIRIGLSSVVKPFEWLQHKAEKSSSSESSTRGAVETLQALRRFAFDRHDALNLDIYGVMTTSTSESGEFQRELMIITSGQQAEADRALLDFVEQNSKDLRLEPWDSGEALKAATADALKEYGGSARIWWQRNVAISRKGVAPMLRDCARKSH